MNADIIARSGMSSDIVNVAVSTVVVWSGQPAGRPAVAIHNSFIIHRVVHLRMKQKAKRKEKETTENEITRVCNVEMASWASRTEHRMRLPTNETHTLRCRPHAIVFFFISFECMNAFFVHQFITTDTRLRAFCTCTQTSTHPHPMHPSDGSFLLSLAFSR